jgi:ABC-2 type transport system ATP-binding protein
MTEGLTREFGSLRAVDGLSLEVPAGTIFGFLGPNGAGKTTTIRMLLGLLEPTAGRAEVLGFDVARHADEVRARTGALLEHAGLYGHLTAEENLEFYGRASRVSPADRRDRIRELLTQMGLYERRGERTHTWSRGMRQRLALARVLLHRPSLVLLDEPTAGLDVMASVEVHDDLTSLVASESVTVFLTTHNMAEAEKLCGQVAVIRHGQLLAVGRPDELRAASSSRTVRVAGGPFGCDVLARLRARHDVLAADEIDGELQLELRQGASAAPVIRLLVECGVPVEEVRRGGASLEDVFVALMGEEASDA